MFTTLTQTFWGKLIATFFLSMLPVAELRAGLPYGIALGLSYPLALSASILGNILPCPFVILFVRRFFSLLRRKSAILDSWVKKLESHAQAKSKKVLQYGLLGLILLVAIPLPGTGAWTGALVAALLRMRLRQAIPCILIGLLIAAGIVSMITYGFIYFN